MVGWGERNEKADPGAAAPGPEPTSAPTETVAPVSRRRWLADHHVALGCALIAVLATSSMVLPLRGLVVADARYEHLAAPGQFVARHLHLWDDARGPGIPSVYFSPVVGSVQALLAWVGTPAWLIGRLTLAVYLTIAGCGALRLSSRLRPGHPGAAVLCGLLYVFNPFVSQFLIPSGLYVPAAALPWWMLFAYDGVHGDRRRAAARFALTVFAIGLLNTASLAYAILPVMLFVVGLVVVEREVRWNDVWRFLRMLLPAVLLVSAAMLTVMWFSLVVLARNLSTTELPSTVASRSSASEAWRGLGLWLTYFRWGTWLRPGAGAYFESQAVVVATYVAPCLAVVGALARRTRYRITFGLILAVSIIIMVGAYRPESAPLPSFLSNTVLQATFARAFRATYKAGPGAQLAIAYLASGGVLVLGSRISALARRWRRAPVRLARAVAVALVGAAFAVAAYPFAVGSVFSEDLTHRRLPRYWEEALDWMNERPRTDRVLVLPGVARADYWWGYVNDNLFEARMRPALLMSQTIPTSTQVLAKATDDVDERLLEDDVSPGAVAPMLHWMGVRWVLVQNDLDVRDLRPPSALDDLRRADGVRLAATFGTLPGGGPAVEVYEVEVVRPAFTSGSAAPLVVSGGTDALAALGANGWLGRPTVNLAQLDDRVLDDLQDVGIDLVVTDGSRRRAVRSTSTDVKSSETLRAIDEPSRPVLTVMPDDTDTQSVVLSDTLRRVASNRSGATDSIWSPSTRAGLALDGRNDTAWSVEQQLVRAEGSAMEVEFEEPTALTSVSFTPTVTEGERITHVRVIFTTVDGDTVTNDVQLETLALSTTVRLDLTVRSMKVVVTGTALGSRAPVGLADIVLGTPDGVLDTREWIRVPVEAERADRARSVSYVFGRPLVRGEERDMRRQFETVRDQSFELTGHVWFASGQAPELGACTELGFLDEEVVRLRITEEPVVVDGGVSAAVESCDDVRLPAGTHRFEEVSSTVRSIIDLSFTDIAMPAADESEPMLGTRSAPSSYTVSVPSGASLVRSPIPQHTGWILESGDRDATPLTVDGDAGWWLEDGEAATVELTFVPESLYRLALAVSAASVLACLWFATRRRRG